MESKDDPILDLQALCEEKPSTKEELLEGYAKLGWEPSFEEVFHMAEGVYIIQGDDGLYHPHAGTISDIIKKALLLG